MARPCAVVGIGQTKYKRRRDDLSLDGLVREAALRALDDAEVSFADIDAVVLGKAPDALEGVRGTPPGHSRAANPEAREPEEPSLRGYGSTYGALARRSTSVGR